MALGQGFTVCVTQPGNLIVFPPYTGNKDVEGQVAWAALSSINWREYRSNPEWLLWCPGGGNDKRLASILFYFTRFLLFDISINWINFPLKKRDASFVQEKCVAGIGWGCYNGEHARSKIKDSGDCIIKHPWGHPCIARLHSTAKSNWAKLDKCTLYKTEICPRMRSLNWLSDLSDLIHISFSKYLLSTMYSFEEEKRGGNIKSKKHYCDDGRVSALLSPSGNAGSHVCPQY